jgi:hypothetical protein
MATSLNRSSRKLITRDLTSVTIEKKLTGRKFCPLQLLSSAKTREIIRFPGHSSRCLSGSVFHFSKISCFKNHSPESAASLCTISLCFAVNDSAQSHFKACFLGSHYQIRSGFTTVMVLAWSCNCNATIELVSVSFSRLTCLTRLSSVSFENAYFPLLKRFSNPLRFPVSDFLSGLSLTCASSNMVLQRFSCSNKVLNTSIHQKCYHKSSGLPEVSSALD